jgi:hypothetical protein
MALLALHPYNQIEIYFDISIHILIHDSIQHVGEAFIFVFQSVYVGV